MQDLTSLGQWEADWQMKFNVAKCHSMKVTQHHKQILFDYSLHNQTLENVQLAKYLGITITVMHLQFWAYGSWDLLFPISMSPNCKLMSPKHYF